ncbi:MAG: radical SAM protein [Coriobacteriia bacterium]|nr:radical SAM protein [Coriobacteriia bacterium]
MRYLLINGEKKKIPPYPHHKDYVYRCYRFFAVKNLYSFLTINGHMRFVKEVRMKRRYDCAIPRDLLIDPTSRCNLRCKGCWAADYSKNSDISFEKLDEIITDAKSLGVMEIVMSGGEPLMRKDDIVKLVKKHSDITFAMFTNGTLVDEQFADTLSELGNLNLFISIEGFREDTDFRRGSGTYDKVLKAMDLLKERDHGFGFSVCYHSKNYKTICSDEFLDFMREKGAWLGWLFNYMPIGSDSDVSLCCNAEQRAYVMEKIKDYHKRYQYTLIDFANTGHKSMGCVAAGTDFLHINSNGDVEPCAFCHYSDTNISNISLLEALQSPFLDRFRQKKPFSKNYLTPCPMMDLPEAIVELTEGENVRSTHLYHPESAKELASKTMPIAKQWRPVADKIFAGIPKSEKRMINILFWLLHAGNRFKTNKH